MVDRNRGCIAAIGKSLGSGRVRSSLRSNSSARPRISRLLLLLLLLAEAADIHAEAGIRAIKRLTQASYSLNVPLTAELFRDNLRNTFLTTLSVHNRSHGQRKASDVLAEDAQRN